MENKTKLLFKAVKVFIRFLASIPLLKYQYCCGCGKHVGRFLPYRGGSSGRAPLMASLDVVGSDIDNFSCPRCRCHDRERHLLLYLMQSGLINQFRESAILHFAPETLLSKVIYSKGPASYKRVDLHPTESDVEKIDIQNIPYDNETFDFVIANHVLEHVFDDEAALVEIRRVLKSGGYAILQTPYSTKLENTFWDPGIDDNCSRFHAYGQEDHVRLYGKSLFSIIESKGFKSLCASHQDILKGYDPTFNGVNSAEPFFLFERI